MSGYLVLNYEHNILICKAHQCAISPKFVARHFLQEHDLQSSVRQTIVSYASQFTVTEALQLTYSEGKVTPVPYLSIIDGYQCKHQGCTKVVGTLHSVKKYCILEHDWKAKDGNYWTETRAQMFYQGNDRRCVTNKNREINLVGTLRSTSQERYRAPISLIHYWKTYWERQGDKTRITNEQLIPFKIILHW